MPFFDYGEIKDHSLDDISKWIQRVKATGMFPITVETVNWVLASANVPYRVPQDTSQEDLEKLLGTHLEMQSRSGDGLGTSSGGMDGTGEGVSEDDNSISNTENR